VAGAKAQTRSSSAGLRLLSLLAALTPAPALAGAWVAPERQQIVTSFIGEAEEQAFYESSLYLEQPIEESRSLVGAAWLTHDYTVASGFRGEATFGLKQSLYQDERWTVAAQGAALWNSEPSGECEEAGGELRLLAGRAFENGWFVNAETAYRGLGGGCGGPRLDLTVGFQAHEHVLALGQIFYDGPDGGDEVVRAQVTLVGTIGGGRQVQLGFRSRIDGGAQELALVVGVWRGPVD